MADPSIRCCTAMMSSDNLVVLVAVLLLILVGALAINHHFHRREQLRQWRQRRSRQLRRDIQQLSEALAKLKELETPPAILKLLSTRIAGLLDQLAQINPEADIFGQLKSQDADRSAVTTPSAAGPQQVHQAQQAIRRVFAILKEVAHGGAITPLQLNEYQRELSWLYIATEADLYISQGRKLLEKDRRALAQAQFRQARTVLSRASARDPRRRERLAEVKRLQEEASPFSPQPPNASTEKDAGTQPADADRNAKQSSSAGETAQRPS